MRSKQAFAALMAVVGMAVPFVIVIGAVAAFVEGRVLLAVLLAALLVALGPAVVVLRNALQARRGRR